MDGILDKITDCIGNTPVLRLRRLSEYYGCGTDLLAKLEWFSPGGSVKDRAAAAMLQGALARGELTPGGTVIDASAGNAGLSLAMVCAAMGLQCIIVLPDTVPGLRQKHLRRYGAQVVTVPAETCASVVETLKKSHPGAFVPDQFRNEDNGQAHHITGQELLRQVGEIDYLVAGVGSGGTITGCAEVIKMQCPDCRIIAVEPFASPVLSGGFPGGHPLAGIGPGFVPEVLNTYILDEVIRVKTPDSLHLMNQLAAQEGLLCGPSSGAALAAAVSVARRPEAQGKTVVTILPDMGERYLNEEF
jgi:cysteine synthase A